MEQASLLVVVCQTRFFPEVPIFGPSRKCTRLFPASPLWPPGLGRVHIGRASHMRAASGRLLEIGVLLCLPVPLVLL